MSKLFKKLNYKGQAQIICLNHPDSFVEELVPMKEEAEIITAIDQITAIEFALVFVLTQEQIDQRITELAPKLKGDATLWFCYPKKSSKKYTCDFSRDTGWQIMGTFELEPVRMVAIDADWSALRFRKVGYIKKITRRESFALTKEAKKRTTQKGK